MKNENLLGLVMCAGKSQRMKMDKSTIKYYQEEQRYHLYKMLQRFCRMVLLNVNESQLSNLEQGFDYILDDPKYTNEGPMAGLVTAHQTHNKNILVIGCDYPLLQHKDIERFLVISIGNNKSTAFFNESTGYYEPMLGYYPISALKEIEVQIAKEQTSLQKYLAESNALKFLDYDCLTLRSVDDEKSSEKAKQYIQSRESNA